MPEKKGDMSVREAGKLGGNKVKQEYGPEFYSQIGKKGGETVSKNRDHMREIGHKGGQRVKQLIEEGKKAAK